LLTNEKFFCILQQTGQSVCHDSNVAQQIAITFVTQLEGIALLWAVGPEAVNLRSQLEIAITLLLRRLAGRNQER